MINCKKNRAIVFGLTSNHIFAVGCVMQDIKRLCPDIIDEVVIFHDGIDEKQKEILSNILRTRFIHYEFPVEQKNTLKSKATQYFTKMVFTKFECLRLLNDYRAVMWLDYDIVIQKDISELFDNPSVGLKVIPGGITVREQLLEAVPEYNMQVEGIVASTFVLFDSLPNYMDMFNFCYLKLNEYSNILYMPEQAIFDFMIQEFKLVPATLDGNLYTPHPTDQFNSHEAYIIHAYGQPKFWNGLYNANWENNYKHWRSLGGSKYIAPNILKKILNRIKVRFF